MGAVVLRYFPALGRAQALRYALADAGVDFDDLRVSPSDWPRFRDDPAFSGRYHALPTLTWDEVTVSEALAIAGFIARRLGQYDGVPEPEIAHREALCSSGYIDVLLRIGDLIWADVAYPGADVGRAVSVIVPHILRKTDRLERQMPEVAFVGGDGPVVADFFASEAFEVLRYVLGPDRDPTLGARFPRLARLARAVSERPRLASARECRPVHFTMRPDEDRVIEGLRAADLSAAGL